MSAEWSGDRFPIDMNQIFRSPDINEAGIVPQRRLIGALQFHIGGDLLIQNYGSVSTVCFKTFSNLHTPFD